MICVQILHNIHRKNDFAEVFKNLTRYKPEHIFCCINKIIIKTFVEILIIIL